MSKITETEGSESALDDDFWTTILGGSELAMCANWRFGAAAFHVVVPES